MWWLVVTKGSEYTKLTLDRLQTLVRVIKNHLLPTKEKVGDGNLDFTFNVKERQKMVLNVL